MYISLHACVRQLQMISLAVQVTMLPWLPHAFCWHSATPTHHPCNLATTCVCVRNMPIMPII
jgi:hypothetical protein